MARPLGQSLLRVAATRTTTNTAQPHPPVWRRDDPMRRGAFHDPICYDLPRAGRAASPAAGANGAAGPRYRWALVVATAH